MPPIPQKPQCEDSPSFNPDAYFASWATEAYQPPYDNDFRRFIARTFGLAPNDDYGYMAQGTEVTLLSAQTYTEMGGQGGFHAWYRDEEGKERTPPPSATDIAAYTDIFRPSTSTPKALTQLAANAKKGSIRSAVAQHLQAHYHSPSSEFTVSKSKKHTNPYFDVWAWTNQNLEWCGPEPGTARVKQSHAVLPVLYHHFGCVCPSYEALEVIRIVSRGRRVIDLGSGNGYWTYMLRQLGKKEGGGKGTGVEVLPLDNGMSEWRVMWVGDTVQADGEKWLQGNGGAVGEVLLLVYPTVGNDFTGRMLKAYRGTTIVCAGSQNTSGFTAFAKETIAEWIAREMPEFKRVLQIPLPSFAGKDEALFVFEKE